jgi:hypothetical protein
VHTLKARIKDNVTLSAFQELFPKGQTMKLILRLIVRRLRGKIQTASRSGVVANRNVLREKGNYSQLQYKCGS